MAYERVNWENLPSKNTPVNADNLNKTDEGIANIENEIKELKDVLNNFPSKNIRTSLANNIDNISNSGYLNATTRATKGTLPTGIGGNSWIIFTGMSNPSYNVQLAFGFGSTKIGMRTKYNSTKWSAWKYVTLT